jgi:hypothetical protein
LLLLPSAFTAGHAPVPPITFCCPTTSSFQVYTLLKGNLILTTGEDCNAQQILSHHSKVLKALTELDPTVTTVREDCSWGKIMVHAVSREIFGGSNGMKRMQEEVEKFNKGVHLMQEPRWLVAEDRMEGKMSSTVVISVQDETKAREVAKSGVVVMGKVLRAGVFNSCKPTDQCQKCQRFGHHQIRCSAQPRCRTCAKNHRTDQHKCSTCSATTHCEHTSPKCSNCKGSHTADSRSCPTYVALSAIQNPQPTITDEMETEPTEPTITV